MQDFRPRPTTRPRSVAKPTTPIIRCDRGVHYKLNVVILSHDCYGHDVHFAGRTVPCPGADAGCQYCEANRPIRWVGYVAATNPDTRTRRFLVELTPGIMGDVDRYFDAYGTLRGSFLQLTRPSQHPTGRLAALIHPHRGCNPSELPAAGDVESEVWRVWRGSVAPGGPSDE